MHPTRLRVLGWLLFFGRPSLGAVGFVVGFIGPHLGELASTPDPAPNQGEMLITAVIYMASAGVAVAMFAAGVALLLFVEKKHDRHY